jgi:hypothetical protein
MEAAHYAIEQAVAMLRSIAPILLPDTAIARDQ